jgi:hypothetical protein
MDAWGWDELQPWLELRLELPVEPLFCVINGSTRGRRWSIRRLSVRRWLGLGLGRWYDAS